MSEQELRDALQEYAAPAPAPAGGRDLIVSRVAARRRRFRVSAAVAAAAAVATVVGVGLSLRPDGGGVSPAGEWQPERTSTAPQLAAPCASIVDPSGQLRYDDLPDLSQVESVRFCSDRRSRLAGEPVALDEGGPVHDPEALVFGVEEFAATVNAMPAADPARCAAISVLNRADTLSFALSSGQVVAVPATMCSDVDRDGTTVDGFALREAFLQALDGQRERVGYEASVEEPVPCAFNGLAGPVRPGREQLTAATLCPDYNDPGGEPRPLTDAGLARLAAAWAKATQEQWSPSEDEDECLTLDDEQQHLVVATNRGDLLRLRPSPCGFLFTDTDPGGHWRVPVALEDLH